MPDPSDVSNRNRRSQEDQLISFIADVLHPLGLDVVSVEIQQRILRVYIDHLPAQGPTPRVGPRIGIDDCVKASKALNEPLDQSPLVNEIFAKGYELEVSSPGINRPLRKEVDFVRFTGERVRIHLFRSLHEEEIANKEYSLRNPKQKNFIGTLRGLNGGSLILEVPDGSKGAQQVQIPLNLMSKAHLEPAI